MLLEAVNLEKELERFFKQLIKQSRKNLKSDGSNASGNLSRNMSYQIKENKNSFESDLLMPKYGEFINYGVKGVESGKSLKGYKYKNKKPPIRFLKTWLKQKTGKFRSRDLTQRAFMVQNAVYKKGIRPTEFFSEPFEKLFATLPEELVEAYGLDVDDFIDFVLKE
tara:strand:+ start:174 stop:671 length:498 start_codon:yes stop_codon:yes gene_type:complete